MSSWPTPPATPEFTARRDAAVEHLQAVSPPLRQLIHHVGACTLAPDPDVFAVLTRAVISQLISTAAALAITRRLYAACGGSLTASGVAALSDETLKTCGISGTKARAIRGVAAAFTTDPELGTKLAAADEATVRARLLPLFGVGPWTVDMLLIFSLGQLDIFPVGDLAVRAGLRNLLQLPEMPTQAEALPLSSDWSPARSVVAWYLWRGQGWVPDGPTLLE